MKTGRFAALASLTLSGFFILHPDAYAQEGVTIYGVADVGLVSDRGANPAGAVLRLDSGQQTQSRLGFKGREDLGGGLAALFVLESGLNLDTGTPAQNGLAFSSQSWVGLSGTLGSVKLGRQFTPYFSAAATSDPFDATGPGDATRLMPSSGYRMNNTVKYSLPPLGGWYADLAYGFGEVAGNFAANRQVSLEVGYNIGPLDIKLGHHRAEDPMGGNPARNTLIGGTYDFGPLKTWLAYAVSKDDMTLDTRDLLVGVTAPFGPNTIAADYIRKTDKFNSNSNASQTVVAYYYYLSPRTNMYALYSRLANDGAASYGVVVPGATDRILTVGIRHRF